MRCQARLELEPPFFSLSLNENQTPFFRDMRSTPSFKSEIIALMSLNLLIYVLKGSNAAFITF